MVDEKRHYLMDSMGGCLFCAVNGIEKDSLHPSGIYEAMQVKR